MTGNQIRKNQLRVEARQNKVVNELKRKELREKAWDAAAKRREQERHNKRMERLQEQSNEVVEAKSIRDTRLRNMELEAQKTKTELQNANEKAKIIIQEREGMARDWNAQQDRVVREEGIVMNSLGSLFNGIVGLITKIPSTVNNHASSFQRRSYNPKLDNKLIGGN